MALGSNPNDGDTISFQLTLPDGSTQTVSLQATSSATPGNGQFSIGATTGATATNLQNALTSAITNLAQTALPAASAMEAGNNFFSDPPQIVVPGAGNNYQTATSLTNGTAGQYRDLVYRRKRRDAGAADPIRGGRPHRRPSITACAPTNRRSPI